MLREELLKKRLVLERQLAATQEELALIARMLELNPEGQPKPLPNDVIPDDVEVYAKMTASEAIMHFLNGHRYEFMTAREVYRALVAGGLPSKARRFANVVYNELDRMVVRGDLEEGRVESKKAYRLK